MNDEIGKLEQQLEEKEMEIQEKDLEISRLRDKLEEIDELVTALYRKI